MKAELNVPSPSILLNKLGIVNARMKASPLRETPKQVKNKTSRKSPNNLVAIVSPLTSETFPIRLRMVKEDSPCN